MATYLIMNKIFTQHQWKLDHIIGQFRKITSELTPKLPPSLRVPYNINPISEHGHMLHLRNTTLKKTETIMEYKH